VAWIPFYQATLDKDNKPSPKYYSKKPLSNFNIKVADSLFLRDDYRDTIMDRITKSKVSSKKEFVYSDLTFIILKEYLEYVKGKKIPEIANENFFSKLGMNNTLYNPLQKFEKKNIVPTEIDSYFRQQVIQGYVHDMGAAMMGGVAGHAGLFSNTMDVAKMMQMYLQKGSYGGEVYFSDQTFDTFNNCYYCDKGNRRGLGFDKPQLEHEAYPTCDCVSKQSFGHTGFTGNIAWTDPETEIVYVFLSNRTYSDVPTAGVNFLAKERIREGIQKVIQEAIIK
jgi:CubicO group peptidase (beta-lactamase class C family)